MFRGGQPGRGGGPERSTDRPSVKEAGGFLSPSPTMYCKYMLEQHFLRIVCPILLSKQTLLIGLDRCLHVNVGTQPSTCLQFITHNYPLVCYMVRLKQLESMFLVKVTVLDMKLKRSSC
jgi:hypothetical protein